MKIASRAELLSRGVDLEDLINFQALELIEPNVESQMMRYIARLTAEVHQANLRLELLIDRSARPQPRFERASDLFPTPLEELEMSETVDPEVEERALARAREHVAAKVKNSSLWKNSPQKS